ncbi:hypothetical protein HG536_0G02950 [Torulaspora globosa]|uniref:N-(5'-phosphoribosyl)anthranilate isomerase n=1 Tax=Torulaspora globosa TaxID=48254 RepID=A0A7G3ZLP7_9SACH|nr:uncharacterized protein HG536_0G02950 [Torulaspora globosa]QLL34433.1 hypothetical protein HG536_0G02950 [Torulaspora globosa]
MWSDRPIVKVCGLQSVEAAQKAIQCGASLIGIICVPNRKRTIEPGVARQISALVHDKSFNKSGTKLVGVFRNQLVEEVTKIANDYNLDVLQLHGDESWAEFQSSVEKPIIKRMLFPQDCGEVAEITRSGNTNVLPLFDSEAGGTGELLDWQAITKWSESDGAGSRFLLAGGVTPSNVHEAMSLTGVIGVDVSGGVETNGSKDLQKIEQFIANARR